MAREGTPQNFTLRKEDTKQYVATKVRILYLSPQAILIKINLRLHTMLWRPVSKNGGGDTLRSLPPTCGRHTSG
jgi:hypothetical protein